MNYRRIGSGKRILLAFHGFTKSSEDYLLYEPFLKDKYTIIAPDLFYHGETTFQAKNWKSFTKPQLRKFFEAFFNHLQIDRLAVLGYSMGGRLALFVLEQFHAKLDHVYLLAPDGLKVNFWNWFVTSTMPGKGLYGMAIKKPGIVYSISNTGQRLKVLPPTMNKFLDINFATKGMRLRVYRVWQLYKNITFSLNELSEIINLHSIPTEIIIGHKDPVIAPKICKDFAQQIPQNGTLHHIKAGHDLFRPHVLDYLSKNVF